MERDGIRAGEAFRRLRTRSQTTNQKLRELAAEVAGSAAQRATRPIAR